MIATGATETENTIELPTTPMIPFAFSCRMMLAASPSVETAKTRLKNRMMRGANGLSRKKIRRRDLRERCGSVVMRRKGSGRCVVFRRNGCQGEDHPGVWRDGTAISTMLRAAYDRVKVLT